jgi:putative heme-binding domain-containing protein
LADLGGEESVKALRSLDAAEWPFAVRTTALAGLAALDLPDAAARAAALLSDAKSGNADPAALLDVFLKREGGVAALNTALAGKKPSADVAKLALRHLNTTGQADPTLTTTLREAAGLGAGAAPPTAEEVQKLVAEARASGDAARGEKIFRRADMGCFQCHGVGAAGGQLGPDLRSIGASSPADYIVESLLDPNKAIKENYASTLVATKSGQVVSGIKVGEDDKQIVLRDAVTDRIAINKADIRRSRLGGSLMPQGLTEPLTRGEFLDLVRFLTELGKPGPYGPDTAQVVRRWRVLDRISAEAAHFNDRLLLDSSSGAVGMTWHAAYAMVDGALPADALIRGKQVDVAFARGEIEVAAPGKIALVLNDAKGLTMWVDDKAVEVKPTMEVDLPKGVHAVTLKIHLPTRGANPLQLEVRDVPGSNGHALAVGGQ